MLSLPHRSLRLSCPVKKQVAPWPVVGSVLLALILSCWKYSSDICLMLYLPTNIHLETGCTAVPEAVRWPTAPILSSYAENGEGAPRSIAPDLRGLGKWYNASTEDALSTHQLLFQWGKGGICQTLPPLGRNGSFFLVFPLNKNKTFQCML